jgi:hypothetical protein
MYQETVAKGSWALHFISVWYLYLYEKTDSAKDPNWATSHLRLVVDSEDMPDIVCVTAAGRSFFRLVWLNLPTHLPGRRLDMRYLIAPGTASHVEHRRL